MKTIVTMGLPHSDAAKLRHFDAAAWINFIITKCQKHFVIRKNDKFKVLGSLNYVTIAPSTLHLNFKKLCTSNPRTKVAYQPKLFYSVSGARFAEWWASLAGVRRPSSPRREPSWAGSGRKSGCCSSGNRLTWPASKTCRKTFRFSWPSVLGSQQGKLSTSGVVFTIFLITYEWTQ